MNPKQLRAKLRSFFKALGLGIIKFFIYTLLVIAILVLWINSATTVKYEPQVSTGLFFLGCSISVYLLYRFLTRKERLEKNAGL